MNLKNKANLITQLKSVDDCKNKLHNKDMVLSLLLLLKDTLNKLIELMNKFLYLYSYEFQNEKYNIDIFPVDFRKEIFYYAKNPNKTYLPLLLDGLDFIKNGYIGNAFKIKNNFDFLCFGT